MPLLQKLSKFNRNIKSRDRKKRNYQKNQKIDLQGLYGRGPDEFTEEERNVFLPEINAYVDNARYGRDYLTVEEKVYLLPEVNRDIRDIEESKYGSSVFDVIDTELGQDPRDTLEDALDIGEGISKSISDHSGEEYSIPEEEILSSMGMHITSDPGFFGHSMY